MSTWIVHLRIAENILLCHQSFSDNRFILGNIAPDSGVPTPDGIDFIPSGKISHFQDWDNDDKIVYPESFYKKYLKDKNYNNETFSFYMGYYVHLLTDKIWEETIVNNSVKKFGRLFENKNDMWNTFKKDWYDLDFVFLKKNPYFKAWKTYADMKELKNKYVEEFDENAFYKRHIYIKSFYQNQPEDIIREYIYLNEKDITNFIATATAEILKILNEKLLESTK